MKDEDEAEDVMQQAYVNAFVHLHQFEERALFSTWLTRIAIHEALGRRRHARATDPIAEDSDTYAMESIASSGPDPERQAYTSEVRQLLESAVDTLPETYRLVFMLREVEGLSTAETADSLELGEEAVKTRLHRARAMLRRDLYARAGAASATAFHFHLSRCDRVVSAVFAALDRE